MPFVTQLGLQVIMGLTGSFSFFQTLTAILAIPLLASAPCSDMPAVSAAATPAGTASPQSVWATVFRGSIALAGSAASTVSTHWAFVEKSVGVAIVAGGMFAFRVPFRVPFRPIFSLVRTKETGALCVFGTRPFVDGFSAL